MLFKDIPGQQAAKEGLLRMWEHNVFPHALLINGAEGVGGLTMGMALVQYIFCKNKTATDACGTCPDCSKVMRMEHPDLNFSFPIIRPKSGAPLSRAYIKDFRAFVKQFPYGTTYEWLQSINAENKQGNISAEECREVINNLNLRSYEGGKKVHLIWRPEYLGKEGNILLKLIEEPPTDTLLIFISEEIDEILLTIRSRTQTVRLAPISGLDIADKLVEMGLADATTATQVGHMAQGSFSEALKLVRNAENDLFPAVRDLFNALFRNMGPGLSKFAEDWSKSGREQQKNFLYYLVHLIEQTLRARYQPGVTLALPDSEATFVTKLAATAIPMDGFADMVNAINHTIFCIERNAHSRTQLHALAIKMHYLVQGRELPVI
jgi:DNA polymerase-3 subunit delta'